MLGLRYFTMLCNNAEYKKMDQDVSLGQLYDVQNEINILYKAKVGPTHFLRHRLYCTMFQVWPKRPCDTEFVLHMDDQISGHGFLPVYTGK